jgi:hypothetical protein
LCNVHLLSWICYRPPLLNEVRSLLQALIPIVKLSLIRLERIERKESRNWEGTETRENRGEWAEKWDWSSIFSFLSLTRFIHQFIYKLLFFYWL